MITQALSSLLPASTVPAASSSQGAVQEGVNSFKDLLNQALQGVNSMQDNAQQLASGVATGDASSLHDAVIASEKAMLAFQLTAQVQSKVIGAYNQVMQMQM